MKVFNNRFIATFLTLLIVAGTLFGVYYVQTTLRKIESSLPIQVVKEKTAVTTLTQNLGYLVYAIRSLKKSPYSVALKQDVTDILDETNMQLKLVRESYKLANLLGAASVHAVIFPALFDMELWLKFGVHHFPANSPPVLHLLEQRSSDALEKAQKLDFAANQIANQMLSRESAKMANFRSVATATLIVIVLLTGWLILMIWRQMSTTEKLTTSELRFKDFANITSDFLWETDRNLTTTYVSEKFKTLTGLPKLSVIGKRFGPSVFDDTKDNQPDSPADSVFQPEAFLESIPITFTDKNGVVKYFQIDGRPVLNKGQALTGYRGGVRDVTDLTLATNTAKEMTALAESANQAKTQFLANMSHEVRSPIAIITGMTDLLLETSSDIEQTARLEVIKDSSNSLLSLVNRVLDISKIESNKTPLSYVRFNVRKMAESIRNAYTETARKKGLSLGLNVDANIETLRIGDKFRIEQILRNLVDNAIKFTHSGEVNIRIAGTQDNNVLVFSVSDTGIGIPQKKQQQLFEPFVQVDASTTRKYGGTGLGLAICKQLAQLMDGEMWVDSHQGSGSTFSFSITFQQETELEDIETDANLSDRAPDRGLRILLVEDDEIMAMLFKAQLRELPHQIETASNGKEALEAFKTLSLDVVYMDILMPEMDGYEAVTQMRELKQSPNRDIPIIALSASVLSSDIEKCHKVGFSGHLSKPIDKTTLLDSINQFAV